MEAVTKYSGGRIYAIRNKINGNVYVGQTRKSVEERFQEHVNNAINGVRTRLCCAMRKNGVENFYIETLEEVGPRQENLDAREEFWINTLNSFECGYNCTPDGQGTAKAVANAEKRAEKACKKYMDDYKKTVALEGRVKELERDNKRLDDLSARYFDLAMLTADAADHKDEIIAHQSCIIDNLQKRCKILEERLGIRK